MYSFIWCAHLSSSSSQLPRRCRVTSSSINLDGISIYCSFFTRAHSTKITENSLSHERDNVIFLCTYSLFSTLLGSFFLWFLVSQPQTMASIRMVFGDHNTQKNRKPALIKLRMLINESAWGYVFYLAWNQLCFGILLTSTFFGYHFITNSGWTLLLYSTREIWLKTFSRRAVLPSLFLRLTFYHK